MIVRDRGHFVHQKLAELFVRSHECPCFVAVENHGSSVSTNKPLERHEENLRRAGRYCLYVDGSGLEAGEDSLPHFKGLMMKAPTAQRCTFFQTLVLVEVGAQIIYSHVLPGLMIVNPNIGKWRHSRAYVLDIPTPWGFARCSDHISIKTPRRTNNVGAED